MKEKIDSINKFRETYQHHEEFDIIKIERDYRNNDDIYIHLKDKDGCVFKGLITGVETE
jgi:hypothetical protein